MNKQVCFVYTHTKKGKVSKVGKVMLMFKLTNY